MNEHVNVLLVTVTEVESRTVLEVFEEYTGRAASLVALEGKAYHDLGIVNGARVWHALSGMGAGGLGGSQQAISKAITALWPSAVVMVGIAFGVNAETQSIGDILVSEGLRVYELQRVGTEGERPKIILRGSRPDASSWLLDSFKNARLHWKGAPVRFGLVLTGEKLVDNLDFREQLRSFEPEAIGGEMEGAGLYVACQNAKVDWILVKAICDWADGHKEVDRSKRQAIAAQNSASFVLHVMRQVSLRRADRDSVSESVEDLRRWTPEGTDPVDRYLRVGLPETCDQWFRPDERFAFHPRDQFVSVLAEWDDQPEGQTASSDLVAELLERLHGGQTRLAISANYGQGKTFAAWKLALTLAAAGDRKPIPFFFPLKEYNPNSDSRPMEQLQNYFLASWSGTPLAELFDSMPCLLILDGADEIPAGAAVIASALQTFLQAFNRFPQLAILLAFRTGLFPGGRKQIEAQLPGFRVATLEPWLRSGPSWRRLLKLCEETSYAQFPGGSAAFAEEVDRRPLGDLTSRPLWCRIIIETRDSILQQDIIGAADLYQYYVDSFFRQRAGEVHCLTPDQKVQVLELLATALARMGYVGPSERPQPVRIADAELRRLAAQVFRMLPDSVFAAYLTHEMRTYSLLDCHSLSGARTVYSFGHNSFEEFFQARALLRLLEGSADDLSTHQDELAVLCQRVLLSRDLLGFVAGLLRRHPANQRLPSVLRLKTRVLFGANSHAVKQIRAALVSAWLEYSRRILQLPRPDLSGFQLDRIELTGFDFSGCILRSATFSNSVLVDCDLTGADLSGCDRRNAVFEGCRRDGTAFQCRLSRLPASGAGPQED